MKTKKNPGAISSLHPKYFKCKNKMTNKILLYRRCCKEKGKENILSYIPSFSSQTTNKGGKKIYIFFQYGLPYLFPRFLGEKKVMTYITNTHRLLYILTSKHPNDKKHIIMSFPPLSEHLKACHTRRKHSSAAGNIPRFFLRRPPFGPLEIAPMYPINIFLPYVKYPVRYVKFENPSV